MTVPNQNTTSPERVVEILERISDAFVALDRNSCYTYMNKKASEIFNRDPQQMIGKYIWAEFPESSGQPIHLAYEKAMKEQQYVYLEEYFAPNHQWFENHIYPSPDGLSVFFRDITDRKRTEQEILISKKKYALLFEKMPAAVALSNFEDGRIMEVNDTFVKIFGYSREEAIGKTTLELSLYDDPELRAKLLEIIIKEGMLHDLEMNLRTKSGEFRTFLINIETLQLFTEKFNLLIIRDITEKKKAEKEIKEIKDRYKALIEQAVDGIIMVDDSGKIILVNEAISNMLGYSRDELITLNIADTYPEQERLFAVQHLSKVKETGQVRIERRMRKKDGTLIPVESIISITNEGNYQSIIRNMTDKRIAEEVIKESEDRYRNFIEGTHELVQSVDPDGKFIFVNKAWEQTLGYSEAERAKLRLIDIIHPGSRAHCGELFRHILAGHSVDSIEVVFLKKNGDLAILEGNSFPRIINGEVVATQSFFRDVTEKKKDEVELKEKGNFIESIINASPDIIYIYDIEERKNVFSNDGIQTNLGYTIAEIKEMGDQILPTLMPKEDFDNYLNNTYPQYATLKDKEILTHEFRMKHKTGGWRWFFTKESIFLRNPDGTPKQIFGVTTDITEQKKADEKLKKSEELFSSIFHTSPAGIIITRIADGKIINANDSFLQMFEFRHEEAIGHTSIELNLLSSDQREKLIQQQISFSGLKNFELLSKTKSGKPINLLFSSRPLEVNNESCHITTLIDITERKKAEEAMKESEYLLKEAQRIAHIGSWANDLTTGKHTWSNETYNIFGVSPEKFTPTLASFFQCIHPDDRELVENSIKSSLTNEKSSEVEYRIVLPDGSIRFISGRGELKYDNQNKPLLISGTVQDITERKKAEKEIINEKELADKIINSLPGIFYMADQTPRLLRWNKTLETLSGYSPEELKTIRPRDLFDPSDHPALLQSIEKTFKEGFAQAEIKLLAKSGEKILFYFTGINIEYKGNPVILGTGINITERKKVEQKIRQSQELYKDLVDNITDLICTHDLDGRILSMNRAAEKAIGQSFDQLKNFNLKDILTTGSKNKYDGYIADILKNGYAKGKMKIKNSSGEIRIWEFNNSLKSTDADTAPLIRGHARDITEQIEAEEKIRKSEIKYRTVVENVHEALVVEDVNGNLVFANNEFCRMFGFTQDEMKNLSFRDYTATISLAEVKERHDRRMSGSMEPEEFEYKARRKDGTEFWIECRVSTLIENGKIIGTQSLERDITEQKKAAEEIKSSNEKLRQLAAHLQTIREDERKRIGREIHDELGQQLTAIKMDLVWVDKKIPPGETLLKDKLKNSVSLLDQSNLSIRKILNELRMDILDHTELADAMLLHAERFTKNTGIPIEFSAGDELIQTDDVVATCLFRVFQESLTNIARYAEAKQIKVTLQDDERSIYLSVQDDGKGFDISALKNKSSFGILGMRERVAFLNGVFALHTSPGKGTRIEVNIPKKQEGK